MTNEENEKIKAYQKAYRESHKEERRNYQKIYNKTHKEERKNYQKSYRETHKEKSNTYRRNDTNSLGITKNSIRANSNRYLTNTLKHTKLKDYEIHHCFGYNNHKCFVYIPKELHTQIHQYLRDNGINADSNHFSKIVHLINAWEGYTYIKV